MSQFKEPETGAWIGMRVSSRGDIVDLGDGRMAEVIKGNRLQYWPIPSAIAGLLVCLSHEGESWTTARRDHWLRVFTQTLDYALPGRADPNAVPIITDEPGVAE